MQVHEEREGYIKGGETNGKKKRRGAEEKRK